MSRFWVPGRPPVTVFQALVAQYVSGVLGAPDESALAMSRYAVE